MSIFGLWTSILDSGGKFCQCRCACGTVRDVRSADLRNGRSTNCGCVRKASLPAAAKAVNTTHGRSDKTEQWVWSDMKRRCYEPSRRGYGRYGGRWIEVCKRWLVGEGGLSGFECFFADIGPRPSREHTLDRAENAGDYEPTNCRWATRDEQNYNRHNTFTFMLSGELLTLADAEARFGVNRKALYQRLVTHGMDPHDAVTRPVRVHKRRS